MKLNQFDHKTIIWTGNYTFLFDEGFCLFVVISVFENYICNDQRNGTRNSLYAMNQNIFLVFVCILNEINYPIEETLNILILWVFKEKSQISELFLFEPILAVVTCTINDVFNFMLLKNIIIFGNFLTWNIQSFDNFTALLLTLLSFTSSLLRPICHSSTHLQTLVWFLSLSLFLSS